jgi:hypothetical protein
MAHVCIMLSLCAAHAANAQNNPKGPAMTTAKQNTFGLGSAGGATEAALKHVPQVAANVVRADVLAAMD